MASIRVFLPSLFTVSLILSLSTSVESQKTGAEKFADLLVALEGPGKYGAFIYALKATGVDADLIKFIDDFNTGVTVLAAEDSAFPDPIEARNAASSHMHIISLRRLISSHIIMEHLTYDQITAVDPGHQYTTFGNPVHTASNGLSAADQNQQGPVLLSNPSLIQMPGAIAPIRDIVMDDGEIACFGINILLIPPTSP